MKLSQIILVLLAVVIGAVLYLTPIAPLAQKQAETMPVAEEVPYDILDDITEIKNSLDSATLAQLSAWEETAPDSVIAYYEKSRQPIGSAYYSLKKAETVGTAEAWTEAGERFLLIGKYMGEMPQRKSWFAQSKECFEKAIELDPADLDIQVDLGVCMMESATLLGTPPMEGIGILKKVEQQDPKNIKALINLGYFAIRSGQFDKAEERFTQVLSIDPNYGEAYLYLADMHEQQKKFAEAIDDLEKFKSLISDEPEKVAEVDAYILELKKNI